MCKYVRVLGLRQQICFEYSISSCQFQQRKRNRYVALATSSLPLDDNKLKHSMPSFPVVRNTPRVRDVILMPSFNTLIEHATERLSGHCIHHLIWHFKTCIFPTHPIYVFVMIPTVNSDHFPEKPAPFGLCNWATLCFL